MTASHAFKVKEGFREPIKSVGFVGREQALSRLRSILGSRNAATVLVAGYRGVGKTSLVDEAVSTGGSGRLVIRLSLPHLYSVPVDDLELRGQILRALARATYFAIKDGDVDADLRRIAEDLYEKTYLRELNESSVLATVAEATVQTSQATKTQSTFSPTNSFKILLGSVAYAAVSVAGASTAWKIAEGSNAGFGILAGLGVMAVAIGSGIALSKTKETHETAHDAVTAKNKTSKVGVFDLSPETLEFELRSLLERLAKSNQSCVFVVDELDKLEIVDDDVERIQSHVIFRIVASLKNFFTLGSGIFIFIAGERFYCRLGQSIEATEYSLAHTLFTDRIYLPSLHWSELEHLVDGLMKPEQDDNPGYPRIRNYLCWESRGHVFDLLSVMSEFVLYDDSGTPRFEARESGPEAEIWREGNLPDYWEKAAGLQKFLGAVFDESSRPSAREDRFNQALWLSLHRAARSLLSGSDLSWREDLEYEEPDAAWLEGLSSIDRDDISGAIERLVVKMERHGAASAAVVVAPQTTQIAPVDLNQPATPAGQTTQADSSERLIRYALVENPPYPPSSIGREAELLPFERSFVEINVLIQRIAANARAASIEFGAEDAKTLGELANLATRVEATAARSIQPRSRVRAGIERADELGVRLVNESIDATLQGWIRDNELTATPDIKVIDPRTSAAWSDGLGEFPELVQVLSAGGGGEFLLVGSAASENQLLILVRPSDAQAQAVAAAYEKSLTGEKGRDRRRQRLPVVNLTVAGNGHSPDVPREVIEVISSDPDVGLFAMLAAVFGGSTSKKKKVRSEEDLAGWHIATVDPELQSLRTLGEKLDAASFMSVS